MFLERLRSLNARKRAQLLTELPSKLNISMSHLACHTDRPPLEAMIVMGAVGVGCAYATYVGTRTLTRHNDVVINRSKGPFGFMTESSAPIPLPKANP